MEKDRISFDVKVALSKSSGQLTFQLKDSDLVCRAIHESLQAELFDASPNSIVVYPDNLIVDSSFMFDESTSVFV